MAINPKHLPVFAPLALVAACGDGGRDVAIGARGTLEGPDVMLNAVTEEVFTVGSVVGDAWDTFGSVQSVAFDSAGNLHIYDSQAEHILVVGRDGSLLRTVGGQGEGPGEFGNVSSAIVARDGSYTVLGFSQVDLFDPGGAFARRIQMNAILFSGLALPDGRLVASSFVSMEALSGPESSSEEEEGRPIHLIPLDGTEPEVLYTAWDLPEAPAGDDYDIDSSRTIRMSAGRAFEPGLYYDVLTDGRLALADSIGYRIKLIGLDGSVTGVIERPIAPQAVDDAIREAERERYRAATAEIENMRSTFQVEREGVEELVFADEVPVIGAVEVDWEDRIWVTRRAADGDREGPVDIVTPDGRYIGTLAADGLRPPDASGPDGLLAYIERDEFDLPTVRVIRLVSLDPEG
ncbi:hypothetical protein [Candidatus Palauibacter sp.]|uniref:hypothetical protein n=1 Tax=Candidatus Palauibacter sp. TaxID=3101350 RepID=UPI003B01BE8F